MKTIENKKSKGTTLNFSYETADGQKINYGVTAFVVDRTAKTPILANLVINFGFGFKVTDIRLVSKKEGIAVQYPAKKISGKDEKTFSSLCYPFLKEFGDAIKGSMLRTYALALEQREEKENFSLEKVA